MKTFLTTLVFAGLIFPVFAQSDFSKEVESIVQKSAEKSVENPVVFIGSSSIRMWETLETDFPNVSVLNHGFGGSEFTDLINHQEELIEDFEPQALVVYAGDNDIANGKEPETIAEQADLFVDGLRRLANGSLVVLLSTKPSIARWEFKEKYVLLNGLLKDIAEKHSHVVYVDVWNPMLKRNGEVKTKLFIEDGLHMNKEGYEIWKNALIPFLAL